MLRFPEAVQQDSAIDLWLKEQAPELGAIARRWFLRRAQGAAPPAARCR
jgi:hypothetical protein